ncbi:MAG: transcriptional regulator, LuxR family [Micrococcaceae bacterium]|nr:transcriptional regulator, LuxR family [Micrococcaceae bacterium]
MGAAERRLWSSVLRQDVASSVLDQLGNPAFRGVVITGPLGVGKTTLARAVESALAGDTHIIKLHGTSRGTASPFGQVAFLAAKLEPETLGRPEAAVHGMAGLIRADAAGRPVLVILDDLPAIDGMSIALLMHLLLSGTAKILVLARSTSDLPEDFLWLLKDRVLASVELDAFTREEVATLLHGVLHNRVSAAAVTTLHASSSGNPLVLHAIVTEQRRTGNLQLRNDVWTISGPIVLESDKVLGELVRARLDSHDPEATAAMEYLALTRRIPLFVLIRLVDPEVLVRLEESGLMVVTGEEGRWASLREPYMAEVIRGWLQLSQRQRMHRQLSRVLGELDTPLTTEEVLNFAALSLDCQLGLAPETALAAAAAALGRSDPVFALRCLERFGPADGNWVTAMQHRAAAMLQQGDPAGAVAVLEKVSPAKLEGLPLGAVGSYWLDFALAELSAGRPERVAQVLAAARTSVQGNQGTSGGADSAQEAVLQVLEVAELAERSHRGEFSAIVDRLEARWRNGLTTGVRLDCGSLLVLAYALTGRELDALGLAAEVRELALQTGVQQRLNDRCREGLFAALLFTGQWRTCIRLLTNAMDERPATMPYSGAMVELGLGLAYTYAGRGDLAIGSLLAGKAQLESHAERMFSRLAHQALAFAYAQVDDAREATAFLSASPVDGPDADWLVTSMAEFCGHMARRWLGDPKAKERLLESAALDLAAGRFTTASISLFGATVHGSDEELQRLEEVSARRQGPMAELNQTVARGSLAKDPRILLEAAAQASELELDAVESRCAVLAVDFARDARDTLSARAAQHRLDRLVRALPVLPLVPRTEGPELTEREREVAKLAAKGMSNREVAAALDVSVRTVEGHLYQIFTKLGITSRAEIEPTLHVRPVPGTPTAGPPSLGTPSLPHAFPLPAALSSPAPTALVRTRRPGTGTAAW